MVRAAHERCRGVSAPCGFVHLVDASVFVFRSWFAVPDSFRDAHGRPVNAVYGYARFIGELLETAAPAHIGVAFDESLTTSFRNDFYPAYKANRPPPPPEIAYQFERCQQLTRALGVATFCSARYEADDLVGTLAAVAHARRRPVAIVSGDKDLAQILREGDVLLDPGRGKRIEYADIPQAFGVGAPQIADFLALTGDQVDNIPGVPGVGKKTAATLLGHFEDLDDIYADLERVLAIGLRGARRVHEALKTHREQVFLARRLTRIACDAPIGGGLARIERRAPRAGELTALYAELGFGEALRRQALRIADAWAGLRAPQPLSLFADAAACDDPD